MQSLLQNLARGKGIIAQGPIQIETYSLQHILERLNDGAPLSYA